MLSPEDPTASEMQPPQPNAPLAEPELFAPAPESFHWLRWTFLGDEGLRAGWSVLIFAILYFLFVDALGFALSRLHLIHGKDGSTAFGTILNELVGFLPMLGVAALIALIERRRSLLAFNLTGPRRTPHFFSGPGGGLSGALGAGGRARLGRLAALWPRRPLRRGHLQVRRALGQWPSCWWAAWKRASSAAICNSR